MPLTGRREARGIPGLMSATVATERDEVTARVYDVLRDGVENLRGHHEVERNGTRDQHVEKRRETFHQPAHRESCVFAEVPLDVD